MAKLKTETTEPKTAGDLRGNNTRAQLFSFVERYERLQEERDALGDDQKEVMAEAKGTGFDTKIIREVIRRRKCNTADLMEHDSILETYEEAVRAAERAATMQSQQEGEGPEGEE